MPKVYAVQSDIVWEDQAANHERIEALLTATTLEAGSLVVLPELFDVGFTMNVAALNETVAGARSEAWCAETARRFNIFLHGAALNREDSAEYPVSNNTVIFNPNGELICRYKKLFLFGKEARHYQTGTQIVTFDWQGICVCPFICYDLRFAELWRLATFDFGAELFVCPANWPDPRLQHWTTLLAARAIENLAYVAGVNRCGADPNLHYSGASRIIDPQGELLAEASADVEIIRAEIDITALREWRSNFVAFRDVRRELLGRIPGGTSGLDGVEEQR